MTKHFLTPVLALAVCAAAYGQSRSYSGITGSSGSHTASMGASRSYSSSGEGISSASPGRYSSSSSVRYSSSSFGSSYGTGGYNHAGSVSHASSGSYRHDSYSSAVRSGSSWNTDRRAVADITLPERNAYLVNDTYSQAVPKAVPTSNDHEQRGAYGYALNGGMGLGSDGGILVNPFYTPGFSACMNGEDPSYKYQTQLRRVWLRRYQYGVSYRTLQRYDFYWNVIRSGRFSMCQQYVQTGLADAKTPAEAVEVMKAYYRCLRLGLNGSTSIY